MAETEAKEVPRTEEVEAPKMSAPKSGAASATAEAEEILNTFQEGDAKQNEAQPVEEGGAGSKFVAEAEFIIKKETEQTQMRKN